MILFIINYSFLYCFQKNNKNFYIIVEIYIFGWYFNMREDYKDMIVVVMFLCYIDMGFLSIFFEKFLLIVYMY